MTGVGTIPACAGNTAPASRLFLQGRDHPRVCGENLATGVRPRGALGPSPRVRGKPLVAHTVPRLGGTIPACAGKTLTL